MPRPTSLPEPWRSLALRVGGVEALAEALHSNVSTVRRWAHEERSPAGPARALIRALFEAHGIDPPDSLSNP